MLPIDGQCRFTCRGQQIMFGHRNVEMVTRKILKIQSLDTQKNKQDMQQNDNHALKYFPRIQHIMPS